MATLRPCEAAQAECPRIVRGGGDFTLVSLGALQELQHRRCFSRMLIEYSAIGQRLSRNIGSRLRPRHPESPEDRSAVRDAQVEVPGPRLEARAERSQLGLICVHRRPICFL